MRRPRAKLKVGQVVIAKREEVPFRIVKKDYEDSCWFYWDLRENGWHYEDELRPLNKRERGE